jgi:hypothetical protein
VEHGVREHHRLLVPGRFFGDMRLADTDGRPTVTTTATGDVGLNWIRDRTRPRDGGVAASAKRVAAPPQWLCFSRARRARRGVCSGAAAAVGFLVLGAGFGVLGGS